MNATGLVVYFMHPKNTYDAHLEYALEERIEKYFPGCTILNPNSKEHEENFKQYQRQTGDPIDYFKFQLAPRCDVGVALPFSDGLFPAGIYKELRIMREDGKPLWKITEKGIISRIKHMPMPSEVLSIEETRKRLYGDAGTMLPY